MKRLLGFILALLLVVSLCPAALAVQGEAPAEEASQAAGLYERYTRAAEKTASLKSEKLENDMSLTVVTTLGDAEERITLRQQGTQILADHGGPIADFYSDTQVTMQYGADAEPTVTQMKVWLKDGTAYVQSGSARIKTEDPGKLGLDSLREGIHSGISYRLPSSEETVWTEDPAAGTLTVALTGETARGFLGEMLDSAHVMEMLFGSDPGEEIKAALIQAMEVTELTATLRIDENDYFAYVRESLCCRLPISAQLQQSVFGFVVDENFVIDIRLTNEESRIEPGTEYEVELPEEAEALTADAETASQAEETASGAASLEELSQILGEYGFTERKVDCMSQECLLFCLDTCDPDHAEALFEERDCAAIAELLNQRFFQALGTKPFKYTVSGHVEMDVPEEVRQSTLDYRRQNAAGIVAEYGMTYYRRVYEENEGLQKLVFLYYTLTDEDGASLDTPADMGSGLMGYVVNGRYYWIDSSLFGDDAETP